MAKKKKASQYDEYITNLILSIFSFAFLVIMSLLLCYRGYSRIGTIESTIKAAYWVSAASAVLAVIGFVWERLSAGREKDLRYKVVRGRNLAIAAIFFAVCSLVAARFFIDGIKVLYVLVPTSAVLVLIYLIYSAEFFIIASMTSLSGLLMWHMSRSYYSRPVPNVEFTALIKDYSFLASVLMIVILVLVTVLVRSASRHDGKLSIGGRSRNILGASANYPLVYISAAVSVLSLLSALIFGAGTAFYLIFAVFGYLFILAVYYTVKLM